MFWKCNNISSPHFDALLQKEGITLQELMNEDDIIQECKSQNKKLVEFLCQRNILEELVTLITEEPSEELDERVRFKYPNIACELLTCDVPALNESLSRDNELLEKLYSFIERDPPLNPLLASFLSRTLGVLIVKRLDQAMEFLKDKENFITLLLKHLGTSAIMDLTLKLITEVGDVKHRQNLLNWLDSQMLVQSLVALFDPKVDSERQHNASQLICDVLILSREMLIDPSDRFHDPILARLESPETVALLLDYMLGSEKSESSIVSGIQVLLALLDQNNSFNDNEAERKLKIAESVAQVIVQRLKDFHQILLDPPKKPALKTSFGSLDPPFGNTRLQVTKLLASLIALNNSEVLREIMRLGTVEVLLDLFFKYVWNNFLHAQVQQCIAGALVAQVTPNEAESETCDNVMYPYLFLKCRLIDKILEAWDDNEQIQTKPKGIRQGYMGHLINIANDVVQQYKKNSSLETFINENIDKDTIDAWNNFVNNSLEETNKKQKLILGGIHPRNLTGDDGNDDYTIGYPQATILPQEMYNDYQVQQIQPDLIESVNMYQNADFVEEIQSALERRANINLVNEGELDNDAEMLAKVCSEYINSLDNNKEEHNSSDEKDILGVKQTDIEAWLKIDESQSLTFMEVTNPWANLDSEKPPSQDGWADFGSFTTDFSAEGFADNSNIQFPSQFVDDITSVGSETLSNESLPDPQDVKEDNQSSGDQNKSKVNEQTTQEMVGTIINALIPAADEGIDDSENLLDKPAEDDPKKAVNDASSVSTVAVDQSAESSKGSSDLSPPKPKDDIPIPGDNIPSPTTTQKPSLSELISSDSGDAKSSTDSTTTPSVTTEIPNESV